MITVHSSRLSSTFPKKNPTARRVYKKGGHTASGEDTKQFLSAIPEPVCATVKLYRDSIRKSTLVVEQLRRVRCTSPTLYDDCGYQGKVSSKKVTERFFRLLQREFTDGELVELAAVIAHENFRSKFNTVFGVQPNDLCTLPEIRNKTASLQMKTSRR